MSKLSYFLFLILSVCQECCCSYYEDDYQNIPEGPRMKGIVATRNAASSKQASEGPKLMGLPYFEE
jgi:hypothetical protein